MNNIHPTALIHPNVKIGDGNAIGPYCVIGYPAEWRGKETEGQVVIGDNNTITGLVTIDSGAEGSTIIGSGCYVMKHAHIGHDAVIENDVTVSCGAKVGGHTRIGKGSNIGLNAVLHQRTIIPEGCMVGASAFVGKKSELKPFKKYAGVPVREIGDNIRS